MNDKRDRWETVFRGALMEARRPDLAAVNLFRYDNDTVSCIGIDGSSLGDIVDGAPLGEWLDPLRRAALLADSIAPTARVHTPSPPSDPTSEDQ